MIKGFTMLEALISLILTGIIMALSYSLFTLVNKQMTMFEKENVEIINYNLFNSTLTNDIHQSNDFRYEDDVLVLKNYTKPDVIYNFENPLITRTLKDVNTETFSLETHNRNYVENVTTKQGRLDLTLKLLKDTINMSYFLDKQTSSVINKKLFDED